MTTTDRVLCHDQHDEIRALLIGRRVVEVGGRPGVGGHHGSLTLDDGTVLDLEGNQDCCAYYDITELNAVDNIITSVEFEEDPAGDDYPKGQGVYRIFVFAENREINLVRFDGTDSNGYYGTGYTITVKEPKR